ncbi:glutamate--tRNA ligase [bacterium]|nr:glutamate--tRNA ligase [bacterium]
MVVTRFAPSPTGFLHLGGARTALFSWLWARHNGGKFILRIEDTDVQRSTDASTDQILDSLRWLGIDWDEGPYFQSQRLPIYHDHLRQLWEKDAIYPAFESKEELDAARKEAEDAKREYVYTGTSRGLSHAEAQRRLDAGEPFAWRFRTPTEGFIEVPETLRGDNDVKFACSEIGDFIINRIGTWENPGMPLYNFVCTVDDALMGVTHVIRGEEHLNNTPKQILFYRALGFPLPTFTHLPLVLKNNKKMSKRDADADARFPVSVSGRRDLGYFPEATVNFVAMLGWSFPGDKELFTVNELVDAFVLDRLVKSAANFDEDKYLHHNGWYMRNLPLDTIVERALPFIRAAGLDVDSRPAEWTRAAIALVIERMRLLAEIPAAIEYLFNEPTGYEPKGVKKVFGEEGVAALLNEAAGLLEGVSDWRKEAIEEPLRLHAEARGIGLGKIAQPIRLAVTGRTASPGLFEVLELLGRDQTIIRIRRAAEAIPALLAANPG